MKVFPSGVRNLKVILEFLEPTVETPACTDLPLLTIIDEFDREKLVLTTFLFDFVMLK